MAKGRIKKPKEEAAEKAAAAQAEAQAEAATQAAVDEATAVPDEPKEPELPPQSLEEKQQALQPVSNLQTALAIQRCNLGKTSLTLPANLTLEEYEELAETLIGAQEATSWWIADFLAFGEIKYGETYAQAASKFKLDALTLKNMASLARRVKPENRNPNVTFSHHRAVQTLPPEEQVAFLKRAEDEKLSFTALKEEVGKHRRAQNTSPEPETKTEPFSVYFRACKIDEDEEAFKGECREIFERELGFAFDADARAEWEKKERAAAAELKEKKKSEKATAKIAKRKEERKTDKEAFAKYQKLVRDVKDEKLSAKYKEMFDNGDKLSDIKKAVLADSPKTTSAKTAEERKEEVKAQLAAQLAQTDKLRAISQALESGNMELAQKLTDELKAATKKPRATTKKKSNNPKMGATPPPQPQAEGDQGAFIE